MEKERVTLRIVILLTIVETRKDICRDGLRANRERETYNVTNLLKKALAGPSPLKLR